MSVAGLASGLGAELRPNISFIMSDGHAAHTFLIHGQHAGQPESSVGSIQLFSVVLVRRMLCWRKSQPVRAPAEPSLRMETELLKLVWGGRIEMPLAALTLP